MIKPKINSSVLTNPGWYLKFGTSLVTLDRKGIAESICDGLEIEFTNLKTLLICLYEKAFHLTMEACGLHIEGVKVRDVEVRPEDFSPGYPTSFSLFHEFLERIRTSFEKSDIPMNRFIQNNHLVATSIHL